MENQKLLTGRIESDGDGIRNMVSLTEKWRKYPDGTVTISTSMQRADGTDLELGEKAYPGEWPWHDLEPK